MDVGVAWGTREVGLGEMGVEKMEPAASQLAKSRAEMTNVMKIE
jgi:hypothetical protein